MSNKNCIIILFIFTITVAIILLYQPVKMEQFMEPIKIQPDILPISQLQPDILPINQPQPDTSNMPTYNKMQLTADMKEYVGVIDATNQFIIPQDSKSKLTYKKYSDFTKEQKDNMYLADIHDMMTSKINTNIPAEEINRIMGKPIEKLQTITNLYNPVYVSNYIEPVVDIDYKYKGYEALQYGSML